MVLDASVAAKWMLPRANEDLVDQAEALLAKHTIGDIEFVVPDLFWIECGNLLWRAIRRKRCSQAFAERGLKKLQELRLITVSSTDLITRAFSIATTCHSTVYDSVYVVLAMSSGMDLVTADDKLVKTVGSRFPVRWLGSY